MGDNTVYSMLMNGGAISKHRISLGFFSRMGKTLNTDLVLDTVRRIPKNQTGNVAVISNTLTDLKSAEHEDYFWTLARDFFKVSKKLRATSNDFSSVLNSLS